MFAVGFSEKQPEKAKNSLINSNFFVIINEGFDLAVLGKRLWLQKKQHLAM
jgi:hypothetical protein